MIAVILGLLQGVLEWLPVSSQGNLVVLMASLMGMDPSEALSQSVYLHLGTGLAALVYFREEVWGILKRGSEGSRRMFNFLLVATALTGAVGLPLFILVRATTFLGEALLALTGAALILTGMIQRGTPKAEAQGAEGPSAREGVSLGLVQGLSAIPGISRSGLTTSALLFKGYSGVEAFRVSFLMSIPAVLAAAIGSMLLEGSPPVGSEASIAVVAAFLSALASIEALIRFAQRVSLWKVCIALGALALLAFLPNLVWG